MPGWPLREAEDLAAIIGMLDAAILDQHGELAEAIRAAAAVIAGAGAPGAAGGAAVSAGARAVPAPSSPRWG